MVFTAPVVDLLARLAGMRVCATYGDMNEDVPLDSEDAHNIPRCSKRSPPT